MLSSHAFKVFSLSMRASNISFLFKWSIKIFRSSIWRKERDSDALSNNTDILTEVVVTVEGQKGSLIILAELNYLFFQHLSWCCGYFPGPLVKLFTSFSQVAEPNELLCMNDIEKFIEMFDLTLRFHDATLQIWCGPSSEVSGFTFLMVAAITPTWAVAGKGLQKLLTHEENNGDFCLSWKCVCGYLLCILQC